MEAKKVKPEEDPVGTVNMTNKTAPSDPHRYEKISGQSAEKKRFLEQHRING